MTWLLYILVISFTLFYVFYILFRKHSISTKIFIGIFCLALWFWFLPSTLEYVKKEDEKLSSQNIIEYYEDRERYDQDKSWWESQGADIFTAIATTNLNLRDKPSTKSNIITVVPAKTKVNLKVNMKLERSGNWFKVGFNKNIGWVYGEYLRPLTSDDKGEFVGEGIHLSFDLFFPEKTISSKIFGFLLGIPISIVISIILVFIFGRDFEIPVIGIDLDVLTIVVPFFYLYIKNLMYVSYSFEQWPIMIIPYLLLAFILDLPTKFVINKLFD